MPADLTLPWPCTVAQAQTWAAALGLDRVDTPLLLAAALGQPRSWLIAHDTDTLPPDAAQRFADWAQRRAQGEPVAYLLGHKEFFGLSLAVSPSVLVPRPDTETLVEWALELIPASPPGTGTPDTGTPAAAPWRVLDLGTGSGAIALAIQQQRPQAHVIATDASPQALAVAQGNARRLGLPVCFALGSWFDALAAPCPATPPAAATEQPPNAPPNVQPNAPLAHQPPLAQFIAPFHLIVSNPPYIAEGDAHLPALRHEPPSALTAGPDGLADLRHIVAQAPQHLAPGGWLLLEHGFDQAQAVQALLHAAGFDHVATRHDLGGQARCTAGQWPAPGCPPR